MLKANLSTRPFYNERAAHMLLALCAAVVLGFTVFNVSRITGLSRANTDLLARATDQEAHARQLRTEAQRVRQSVDPESLDAVSVSAREANVLIDRRLFSWTELFNYFETALPDDVRITSVHPRPAGNGTATVAITAVSRRVEDLNRFMDALEATHAFKDVLSRDERTMDDGSLVAVLEGTYLRGLAADGRPAGGNP
jgi:Tfp pilus assembly protein PilN